MSEFMGFVYIWRDKKKNRYYVGSHIGKEDDGYICSSSWMLKAIRRRPEDFKRRILKRIFTNRSDLYNEEQRYLDMIKRSEVRTRYYNLRLSSNKPWFIFPDQVKTIGEKISFRKTGVSTGPCSEETKRKISEANSGREFSDEHIEKLRQSRLGSTHSDEWKEEASRRTTEQWTTGQRKALEHQTEESNRKRSEALKGRQLTIPTDESRRKQSEKKMIYWQNVRAGLIPPRKPRTKKKPEMISL